MTMQSVGLLIEFKDGNLKPASLGTAAAARGENRQLVGLVLEASAGDANAALAAHGVARIVTIRTGGSGWNPATQAAAVVAAMHEFAIGSLVGLTSPAGRELLPRIAALLDAPLVMDCTEIDLDGHRAKTSQYSGKTMATIAMTGRHFIYGLRANTIAPVKNPVAAKMIDFTYADGDAPGHRVVETRCDGNTGTAYLAEADVIVAGGRGLKNGQNFTLLFDCARHLNAAVGASRVAVDNGWVPYAMQVGQTGVKVNPKVYLAVGISGSVQHFAGMKTAKMIIAVNSDANAAIMANCDYFVVGDLFEILPELEKALANRPE